MIKYLLDNEMMKLWDNLLVNHWMIGCKKRNKRKIIVAKNKMEAILRAVTNDIGKHIAHLIPAFSDIDHIFGQI